MLGFADKKMEAKMKNVQKQDSGKHEYNGKSGKSKLESELEPKLEEKKKPDFGILDHNAKTKISKDDTEELKDVIKLKKKKPLMFGIDYKVMKMLVFGENRNKAKHDANAKINEGETEELKNVMELKEKKHGENNIEAKLKSKKKQDLGRLDYNSKSGKSDLESKQEPKVEPELEERKPQGFCKLYHNTKTKISKDNTKELKDLMEMKEKKL